MTRPSLALALLLLSCNKTPPALLEQPPSPHEVANVLEAAELRASLDPLCAEGDDMACVRRAGLDLRWLEDPNWDMVLVDVCKRSVKGCRAAIDELAVSSDAPRLHASGVFFALFSEAWASHRVERSITPADPVDPLIAQLTWRRECAPCHTDGLRNGPLAGPGRMPGTPLLFGPQGVLAPRQAQRSEPGAEERMHRYAAGRHVLPASAYGVSDDEASHLLAWLWTTDSLPAWAGRPATFGSTRTLDGALDATGGQSLFGTLCVSCHGPNPSSGYTALSAEACRSDGRQAAAAVLKGRRVRASATEGVMPGMADTLSDGQVQDIVRYMCDELGVTIDLPVEDVAYMRGG